ncbi:MAG: glycosyltransferase, partial [Acidobacteria bacterium]|nr:glycosyltransferase [Acidobacteriota bacterium]
AALRARRRDGSDAQVEFSVLITCHWEEKSIDEFYTRLTNTLQSTGRSYEIIFVNDGSRDRTWEKLKGFFASDPHVYAVLDMFRNAGQNAGITAALVQARGSAFVLMDSDLQLLPEELPLLIEQYDQGYDLVTGYRVNRKDPLFRIIPWRLANMIMRRASRSSIREFGCTFKIYNADFLRAFEYGPRRLFSNVELISRIDRISECR